ERGSRGDRWKRGRWKRGMLPGTSSLAIRVGAGLARDQPGQPCPTQTSSWPRGASELARERDATAKRVVQPRTRRVRSPWRARRAASSASPGWKERMEFWKDRSIRSTPGALKPAALRWSRSSSARVRGNGSGNWMYTNLTDSAVSRATAAATSASSGRSRLTTEVYAENASRVRTRELVSARSSAWRIFRSAGRAAFVRWRAAPAHDRRGRGRGGARGVQWWRGPRLTGAPAFTVRRR